MTHKKDKVFSTITVGTQSCKIRVSSFGLFSAELGGLSYSSKDCEDVIRWARQRLKDTSCLEWKPVMEVHSDNADTRVNCLEHCTNIQLYIERYYIAWDGKQWIQCPWVVHPPGTYRLDPHDPSNEEQCKMEPQVLAGQRLHHSKPFSYSEKYGPTLVFPIIQKWMDRDKIYIVPYNDQTWSTMIGIIHRIRELRGHINKLLSTDSGWGQLAEIAKVKLLN